MLGHVRPEVSTPAAPILDDLDLFAVEEGASLGKLVLWFPPATLSYSLPDYLCLLAALINILWVLLIWLVVIQFALRPGAREPE